MSHHQKRSLLRACNWNVRAVNQQLDRSQQPDADASRFDAQPFHLAESTSARNAPKPDRYSPAIRRRLMLLRLRRYQKLRPVTAITAAIMMAKPMIVETAMMPR